MTSMPEKDSIPQESHEDDRRIHDQPGEDRRPETVFPPFDDPAFAAKQAEAPVIAERCVSPPRDTQYAGHPEFSQDAAVDEPIVAGQDDRQSAAHGPLRGRDRTDK